MEMYLELILANTNPIHPPRGVSTNDFANVTRKVRETEIILEKEVGIMLDADGRVILDKSINYGK